MDPVGTSELFFVIYVCFIGAWLNIYEGRFPPRVQDHQSIYKTVKYHEYAVRTSEVPQKHCLPLDSVDIQTSLFK